MATLKQKAAAGASKMVAPKNKLVVEQRTAGVPAQVPENRKPAAPAVKPVQDQNAPAVESAPAQNVSLAAQKAAIFGFQKPASPVAAPEPQSRPRTTVRPFRPSVPLPTFQMGLEQMKSPPPPVGLTPEQIQASLRQRRVTGLKRGRL